MVASSTQVADTAQAHPAAIRALEQRTIPGATQPLAQALTAAHSAATARWIRETTTVNVPELLAEFAAYVTRLLNAAFADKGRQAQRAAERAGFTAAHAGARQASQLAATMRGTPTPPVNAAPGDDAQAAAEAIPAAVQEEHNRALALLTTASLTAMGLAGLNSVFARARRAIGRITAAIAVTITTAHAHGANLAARALGTGVRLLWVPEPDACPACAAYAGRSIRPGGKFQGGLSTDPPRTVFLTAITGPPRHPRCRCVLIPWSPTWPLDGPPLPTLLRQRAHAIRRTA
ncbi:hypothetical protein ACIQNU_04395 [Streptomyces sp. NPDC091292]|uniref:hypothetical protein n=1 Tax=Streptomyces sp. NPDC091292 TaxID=3365991 RepID=UPI00381C21F6